MVIGKFVTGEGGDDVEIVFARVANTLAKSVSGDLLIFFLLSSEYGVRAHPPPVPSSSSSALGEQIHLVHNYKRAQHTHTHTHT